MAFRGHFQPKLFYDFSVLEFANTVSCFTSPLDKIINLEVVGLGGHLLIRGVTVACSNLHFFEKHSTFFSSSVCLLREEMFAATLAVEEGVWDSNVPFVSKEKVCSV